MEEDVHGNTHGSDGRFVSLREYFERILQEKDSSAEFKRQALADALALVVERIALLESGGAPFASRLDQSLTALKDDVETLNDNAVKTEVLEALRVKDEEERKSQKRRVVVALVAGGGALAIVLLEAFLRVSGMGP